MNEKTNGAAPSGIPEDAVVRELNLPRSVLRAFRGAHPEVWHLDSARRILWNPAGVAALKAVVAGGAGADTVVVGGARPVRPEDIQRLVLVRTRFVNTRVIHGHVEGESWDPRIPEIVKVTHSGRFVPGMVILARHVRSNIWEFAGNPARPEAGKHYPRAVGVW